MGYLIKIEDFNGNVIEEVNDNTGLMEHFFHLAHRENKLFNVARYIDPYDDTIFNSLQIKDLLVDIEKMLKLDDLRGNQIDFLNKLKAMCNKALDTPQQYLKFYGD